jgi:hypothetical protein
VHSTHVNTLRVISSCLLTQGFQTCRLVLYTRPAYAPRLQIPRCDIVEQQCSGKHLLYGWTEQIWYALYSQLTSQVHLNHTQTNLTQSCLDVSISFVIYVIRLFTHTISDARDDKRMLFTQYKRKPVRTLVFHVDFCLKWYTNIFTNIC